MRGNHIPGGCSADDASLQLGECSALGHSMPALTGSKCGAVIHAIAIHCHIINIILHEYQIQTMRRTWTCVVVAGLGK